jgi:hypothetical protein
LRTKATEFSLVYQYVAVQPSFLTVWVADAHVHVQGLVSVVKMATMFEDCTIKEQRSVVCFYSYRNVFCLWWEAFVMQSSSQLGGKHFVNNEEAETQVRQ